MHPRNADCGSARLGFISQRGKPPPPPGRRRPTDGRPDWDVVATAGRTYGARGRRFDCESIESSRVESSRRWSFRSRKSIPSLLRIRKGGSGFQIFLRIDPRCALQFSFSSSFSFFWSFELDFFCRIIQRKDFLSESGERERERFFFHFSIEKKRREEGRR